MQGGSLAFHILLVVQLVVANRDGDDKVASASKLGRNTMGGSDTFAAASVVAASDGHFVKLKGKTDDRSEAKDKTTLDYPTEITSLFQDPDSSGRSIQAICEFFTGQPSWDTAHTSHTANIQKFVAAFDFDGNGKVDSGEQEVAIKIARYFAGDDEILQEAEIADMDKVIKWFGGVSPGGGGTGNTRGASLDQKEAQLMVRYLRQFDSDLDDDLDDVERFFMVTTCRFFAGANDELDQTEAENMQLTIGHFDGTDNKLDKKEMRRMIKAIELYDINSDKALDLLEQTDMVVFIRFTGDDAEMTVEEHKNMEWVVDFFDGEDNKLQDEEARRILVIMTRFDFDRDGDLDESEQGTLVRVGRYFATGRVEECTECRDIGKKEYDNLITVIDFFDGNMNQLDEDESNRMVLTLLYFDGQPDGKLDATEQGHLVNILTYFAGIDGELDVNEWESMKKAIDYFCGADSRLQTGGGGEQDEQAMFESTCAQFAKTSGKTAQSKGKAADEYLNEDELTALVTKISAAEKQKVQSGVSRGESGVSSPKRTGESGETEGGTVSSASASTDALLAEIKTNLKGLQDNQRIKGLCDRLSDPQKLELTQEELTKCTLAEKAIGRATEGSVSPRTETEELTGSSATLKKIEGLDANDTKQAEEIKTLCAMLSDQEKTLQSKCGTIG